MEPTQFKMPNYSSWSSRCYQKQLYIQRGVLIWNANSSRNVYGELQKYVGREENYEQATG